MKRILLILLFIGIFTSEVEAQCSITTNTSASTLTCGTSPLIACNGILNIGNGTTPITLNMNSALDLTCLGPIQVVVNNATIYFQSGNNRLTLAEGSSITFTNGATLSDASCNASERIYIGANLLASCNGGAGADLTFPNLVTQGGTGSATSNSPVCSGNTIILSATPPPIGTYTYAWSGPGLNTSYGSSSTYSFTATASSSGTYTAKMKSSSGIVTEMLITVTVNSGASTAAPTVSLTNPNCSVATGTISITAPSGMKYSIDGITYTNTSGVFTPVSAGNYNVTAKNSSGCISPITSATVAQVTNTWNGTSWSVSNPPTSAQKIVFAGDYASSSDITGCSCQVASGNVVFTSGTTLSVVNEVKVTGGSLSFDDKASLVQTNDAAVNSGNITYRRETSPLKLYDYTYWSSPVANATLSQLATNSLCFSFSPSINNWVYQDNSTTMTPGVGYIGMTPDPLLSATLKTNFVGVPNNGVVNVPIVKSAGTYNLIGNPYPSAIDVDLFLTDAANSGVVNGTVYFWTHNTSITNNNYTINDYAKYNFTGSVRTSTAAISGGALPTGKIGAGQGFFIEANTAKANGTYTASFKNSMRIAGNNAQFFRNSNSAASSSVSGNLERHRLWLSLTDVEGAYNQMLLGYVEGATNDFDTMFDGKTMPVGNSVAIYTKVGEYDLSIQGRSLPFSENDVIPLGYSSANSGTLTLSLDNLDGLFETQNVYLLDKVTGIYHDIKAGPVNFNTVSGTFDDRFELRFTNNALATVTPDYNAAVIVVANQNQLTVLCDATPIAKVEVFDILGKQILSQKDLNTNHFQSGNLLVGTQALLVKITLDNDVTIIKKTLMN